ncbi:MAG: orotate phosphoribosyltransferase [Anaerolineae bacterium]|nr:orotate phosphoribosyltransferase [Anaerolineae bacterium]
MYKQQVARALLEINAVGFSPHKPITFKSGLISPVYVDNRRIPYWPEQWQKVIAGFQAVIAENGLEFDVIAGIESGGIPHSATLGYVTRKPSVFVRKQPKEHGTKSRIEGGDVANKRVLLVEDLVTTGGSSLAGVEALRQDGAQVDVCLTIVSYEFAEAASAFTDVQVRLYPLTSFAIILQEAFSMGRFTADEMAIIEDWLRDPAHWAEKHGF